MTFEQTREQFLLAYNSNAYLNMCESDDMHNVIVALEKQIPKKPRKEIWVDDEKRKGDVRLATNDDVLTKDNHDTITHCPNCDEWVTVQKYLSPPKYDLFCRNCGQALDWSDTE